MPKQIRRIVTGHNAEGKSVIAEDAIATSILDLEAVPGLRATDLWETTTAPADLSGDADPVDRPMHLEPRPTGQSAVSSSFRPMRSGKTGLMGAKSFPPWRRVMPPIPPTRTR